MLNLELINISGAKRKEYDVENIVFSNFEYLDFKKYFGKKDVKISYIESELINPKDNIKIQESYWKLKENNPNFLNEKERQIKSYIFNSEYKDVLISHVSYINKQGIKQPLYFKHRTEVTEGFIYSIKNGLRNDVGTGFLLKNKYLYNNYVNVYNEETGDYEIFFVSGVDENGKKVNELLNNKKAIDELSWENISLTTGEVLKPGYTIEQKGNIFEYQVFIDEKECENEEWNLSIKPLEENIIKILKPKELNTNSAWNIQITNGRVFSKRKYFLPEYENQNYDPVFGVLKRVKEPCKMVSKTILKAQEKGLFLNIKLGCHIKIFGYDINGDLKEACTTEKSLIGKEYKDEIFWKDGISSWSKEESFIETNYSLNPYLNYYVSYYFETKNYYFGEINLNPIQNKQIINSSYLLYVKPGNNKKSLEYLEIDFEGRIKEASQEEFKLVVNEEFNSNTVIGMNLIEFREKFIVGFENDYEYLELGIVSMKEDFYLDEIKILDSRNENECEDLDLASRQWKVCQSKYGYGKEGQTVQKNNLIYLEIPTKMLSSNGGEYTKEEIERIIRRKVKNNVDVIVDYTYSKSKIEINNNLINQLELNISWEKPGVYHLYRKVNEETVYKKINEITSTNYEEIIYIDSDLNSGDKVFYKVKIDDYNFGNTYGAEVR